MLEYLKKKNSIRRYTPNFIEALYSRNEKSRAKIIREKHTPTLEYYTRWTVTLDSSISEYIIRPIRLHFVNLFLLQRIGRP